MFKRRRYKQQLTLQDRLSAWVKQVQQQASKLPPGPERDALLKKARQPTSPITCKTGPNPRTATAEIARLRQRRFPTEADAHQRRMARPPSEFRNPAAPNLFAVLGLLEDETATPGTRS